MVRGAVAAGLFKAGLELAQLGWSLPKVACPTHGLKSTIVRNVGSLTIANVSPT